MSKIPPELRQTAAKAVSIERQEVGSREFGHNARNVAERKQLGKKDSADWLILLDCYAYKVLDLRGEVS